MRSWAVVDTNLLLLLVVGRAGLHYIDMHKRLNGQYSDYDYIRLNELVGAADGIVIVPQVLTEVSNLARQIREPARHDIMAALRRLIGAIEEVYIPSKPVVLGRHFLQMGLTDAILLWLCAEEGSERAYTLLTNDQELAARAGSLGYSVLNYSFF